MKPLYIKAFINDKPINRVFINRGAMLNVMPIIILKTLGKNKSNLIFTNMKMTNFRGDVMVAIKVLMVDIIEGSRTLNSAFFIVS